MGAAIVFFVFLICLYAGALAGMKLRRALPEHHLDDQSREVVKTGAALIATLSALVLGLLVASSKDSFDQMNVGLLQAGAKMIVLDRTLSRYGPEARQIREDMRDIVMSVRQRVWPASRGNDEALRLVAGQPRLELVRDEIQALTPKDELQRDLQSQGLRTVGDLLEWRWLMVERARTSMPGLFLVALALWLTVLFVSFGLLAPSNKTVIAVLFICALSVSSTVFLILEMDTPLQGLVKVPSTAIDRALQHLGK